MQHTDAKEIINLLKTSKGQMDGIIKMIDDDRYCLDISKQILAVQALLRKANLQILDQHIKHCVKDALINGNGEQKVDEVIDIINKYIK